MHNRSVIFALVLAAAGCGGQLDNHNSDDGAEGEAFGRPIPVRPAPALIEWQFNGCLTPDQRVGLIAALQQIDQQAVPGLLPSTGESVCGGDGDERGALFRTTSSEAGRQRTLALLSIRPVQRSYTFAITANAIAVTTNEWYQWLENVSGVTRFDDSGKVTPNGRYSVSGYAIHVPSPGEVDLLAHVVDTTNGKTADLLRATPLAVRGSGELEDGSQPWRVSPALSNDPLVQTILNAAGPYLAANQANWELYWAAPVSRAIDALHFAWAPSLKGWPMPFDLLSADAAGTIYASGGDLIM